MTDDEIQLAITEHRPITVAGLTLTDVNGPVRVDLPHDRDVDAVLLDEVDAQRLVCWLSGRLPVVRDYIHKLRCGLDAVQIDRGVQEFLQGPTLGERIRESVRTIRQNPSQGKKRHNGDMTWLARQIGVQVASAGRYLKDQAIPEPQIASKIAAVLGWPEAHMTNLIHAAKIRAAERKARGGA